MENRLTKWNGTKFVLPQGHGVWRQIAERLAAYEETGLEPEEIIALKVRSSPKAEDLSPEELERAFRIRDWEYMKMDARTHIEQYVDAGTIFDEDITDDVLDDLVSEFEHDQDCESPENATWGVVVQEYVRDKLTPNAEDIRLIQNAYNILIEDGEVNLDEYFVPVLERKKELHFYKLVQQAYDALKDHDVEEATGVLGECLE